MFTPRFNYALQLWVGSTLLASGSNLSLTSDTSGVDFAGYSSGPNNPQTGQPLTIVLSSMGAAGTVTEAFFDNIALVATPSSGVQNPSFEAATLPIDAPNYGPFSQLIANSTVPNYALNGTLENWKASSTTKNAGAGAGAPILGGNEWTTKWWTGNIVGWVQTTSAGTASLSQTLSQTLQNNTVYTLSAMVGRRIIATQNYYGQNLPIHFNYSIQLWAGSTMLASASNLGLANDSSGTDSVSYSSGLNSPQAGQPLMIVLSSTGSDGAITEADFDNVALTATTASVAVNGVVSASAFGGFSAISPGSWIEIYGSNLAPDTRSWNGSDFSGVNAPTKLDGTFVTIGGELAFIDFISPAQVNALVPSNVGTGPQQLTVTTSGGVSSPFTVNVDSVEPGLLAPSSFDLGGTQYVVAQFTDGTYVLPTGAIAGVNSRPAKPGDTVILYGIGFGPVVPNLPAGQLVGQSNTLGSGFQMSVGGQPAMAQYSGLAPNYTGLYQFNIVVPNTSVNGPRPLTFTLDGTQGTQKLSIAVQN